MDHDQSELRANKSLGEHFTTVLRRKNKARPRSFYLLLAVLAFVILAPALAKNRQDPYALFAFVTLNLVFFYIVVVFAIRDCRRIVRGYVTERQDVYRSTLGDQGFAKELGQRVKKGKE
jgi:uncharacterized membrane protein